MYRCHPENHLHRFCNCLTSLFRNMGATLRNHSFFMGATFRMGATYRIVELSHDGCHIHNYTIVGMGTTYHLMTLPCLM
jgi:hypothetical protein